MSNKNTTITNLTPEQFAILVSTKISRMRKDQVLFEIRKAAKQEQQMRIAMQFAMAEILEDEDEMDRRNEALDKL